MCLDKNTSNRESHHSSTFAIIPAFIAGMNDGFNPVSVLGLFLFLFAVLRFGKNWREKFWFGLVIIPTSILFMFAVQLGMLDLVLYRLKIELYLNEVILLLGCFSLLFGLVNFYDWILISRKKINGIIIQWPDALINKNQAVLDSWSKAEPRPQLVSFYKLVLVGIVFGLLIGMLQLYWSPSQLLAVTMLEVNLPGKELSSALAVFVYCVMYSMPLIASLYVITKCLKSARIVKKLQNSISKLKIICSAMYIALGVGLIYVYY